MVQWLSIVLLLILQLVTQPVSEAADATMEPKAIGADVVRAAIRKIRNSCIFPNDFDLMLRIAWVESFFGSFRHTFREDTAKGGKGIWHVDEIGFKDTKLVKSGILDLVKSELGVDWNTMTFASTNMNVPLYNALAALLMLSQKPAAIPPGIEAQAIYWMTYYNSAIGTDKEMEFINKLKSMLPCSTVGADLLFILDISGSIGTHEFQLMKQAVVEVAKKVTIGADATHIAVLTFDIKVQERINFGEYSSLGPLTTAINALKHTRGLTRTHLALDQVAAMFKSARALDKGFSRVVIVLTDGESTDISATREAAERLNSYRWLERYAVGMGHGVNVEELQFIASGCSNVYLIPTVSAITALTDELHEIACQSSAALPPSKPGSGGHSRINGTLAPNAPRNARDTAASYLTGRTSALLVTSGAGATLYVSLKLENPSSAVYDYIATADGNRRGVVFVSPSDLTATVGALSRHRRDLSSNSSSNASDNATVYMSIVPADGSGESVTYQLDAHDGDRRSMYMFTSSAPGRPLNLLLLRLALAFVIILVTL